MQDGPAIQRLLEEVLESGRPPEEVCRERPELLSGVRELLLRARRVEAELEALFPTPGGAPRELATPGLPAIPGYELEGVLGRGGMGVVYKARHQKLDRPVAIKMLLSGAWAAPSEIARFLREAEAVARLRHPHIVQIYDVGEVEGRPYFTMELVEGRTLAQELAGEPQPASRAAELLLVLAEAVQAAHAAGVVHRDLKPANILIDAAGAPRITDFGLARRIDGDPTLTMTGARLGTPSYMAPEQALGRTGAIGPAVDVYALGALLYEVLTGRPPFRGESAAETERQVIADEPVPPARLNAKVPRDLETICLKCLRKEPAARYASAQELALDLGRFQRGAAIAARPVGRLERAARWVRRNPTGGALIVTALASLALAIGMGARELADSARRRLETEKWNERLSFVHALLDEGRFTEARAILGRVPDGGSGEIGARIAEAQRELDLVERLDAIRMGRAQSGRLDFDVAQADAQYAEAFAAAGFDALEGEPAEVAARIGATSVREAIVAALDDWAACARKSGRWPRLLEIARLADPHPWRDRGRDPALWADADALRALLAEVPPTELTVPLAMVLASFLDRQGGDSTAFLRQVQAAHPDDFWANFLLAETVGGAESIGFYRAALALCPRTVGAHVNLGLALLNEGRVDEAVAQWRRAIAIDPDSAVAHTNLGFTLLRLGHRDETLEHARAAVRLDPSSGYAYDLLARGLLLTGDLEESMQASRRALELIAPEHPYRVSAEETSQTCEHLQGHVSKLQAVLDRAGEALPPEQLLEFAEVAVLIERFEAGATLYARAFDAQAEAGVEIRIGERYNAICAAALAGSARDADAARVRPEARLEWRRQARYWFESDLLAMLESFERAGARERADIVETFGHWKSDRDLSPLREPEELADLPAEEREACLAIWAEIDAWLATAGRGE